MTKLMEFLIGRNISDLTKEISVSKNIPEKFTIKTISQERYSEIQNRCMNISAKTGATFNTGKFNLLLIAECCASPNFSDASVIDKLGVATASEAISRVLLPGEIEELSKQIHELNGFNTDINKDIEEAKN